MPLPAETSSPRRAELTELRDLGGDPHAGQPSSIRTDAGGADLPAKLALACLGWQSDTKQRVGKLKDMIVHHFYIRSAIRLSHNILSYLYPV